MQLEENWESDVSILSVTCPKCGLTKKSKPSCCGRGGAWFKNCGDDGDTNFEHTFTEGFDACKGKLKDESAYQHADQTKAK